MNIQRPSQEDLVKDIAREYGYPMAQVTNTVRAFQTKLQERVAWSRENPESAIFGVLPLDDQIRLNPGLTVIYGFESSGKTALAKRIAICSQKRGMNVIYWDAENKLYLHDLRYMRNIVMANSRMAGDLKAVLRSNAVDLLIIDTVTSMEERTSFIRRMMDFAPFLVITAQMKSSWGSQKAEPACYEPTLSTSHTRIHLTSKEPLTVERVDMERVQYRIDKYEAFPSLVGERGSFIIKDAIVDNVYTAYDHMKAHGRIGSIGFSKTLDQVDLGGRMREIGYKTDIAAKLISEYWKDVAGTELPYEMESYTDDHESMRAVPDTRSTRRGPGRAKLEGAAESTPTS